VCLVSLQKVILSCLIVLSDKDFRAVEEAFEWSRPTALEHFYKGSWRQNCMPVAVYCLLFSICFRFCNKYERFYGLRRECVQQL